MTHARHRAARRPSTPLTDLAAVATEQLGHVGRRSAVVAASSGLVVSSVLGAAPAMASPSDDASAGALAAVDTNALTASARALLETAPVVSAPADAKFTIDDQELKVTLPAPEPEPVVVAPTTTRTTDPVSRSTPVANSPIPQSVAGNKILEIAARYVGVPYVYGGSTPSGFDCSGFTSYVYAQVGISLPRSSSAQHYAGQIISRADAQPGDLIWSPGHIAIYAGGNMQIDAPRPGKTIQFREIWQSSPVFIRIG
ncbi:C40 family peptidase [Cellulomonas sp. DKR-3]|uniref:C40 family peptidase n=1 Tax=Cellulomonas fulva TaxID=2835530 RepID=A0ABS5TV51_9CELL|nr:C40 family peptidase [Cellulomonas fulva]MBT0993033.1 C40 family peptidase [Cellulomonas fulva]